MKTVRRADRLTLAAEIQKARAVHSVCGGAVFRPVLVGETRILAECTRCQKHRRAPGDLHPRVALVMFDRITGDLHPAEPEESGQMPLFVQA